MEELRNLKDFPEQIRSAMLRALPEMELVKYAGQSVSTEKHMQYRALIGQLIEETSNNEEQKYILITGVGHSVCSKYIDNNLVFYY